MPRRRHYVSDQIDRYENGESSGSDNGQLTAEQQRVRQRARERGAERLAQDLDSSASDDLEEVQEAPVKVEWSSEDDAAAVYNAFKSRKRKQPATTTAASGSRRKKISTGVGKQIVKREKKPARGGDLVYGDDSDQGDDDLANNIPDYLKDRRKELADDGFRMPPEYHGIEFSDDERLGRLKERPFFDYLKPPAAHKDITLPRSAGIIPGPIARWLKPYQVEGADFLHELFTHQRGGILGDDMGLGKTIQVIAALTAAFGKTGDERDAKRMRKVRRTVNTRWYPRVLIICPGSLLANWKSELDRWGWWHVYTYHGSVAEKDAALGAAVTGRLEILITTYRTYVLNKSAINGVAWDCCIADECHTIKERKSDVTQAMNDVNAMCRIGLTGTAIQNKYDELWTLLNWTNPGLLGPLAAWRTAISEPLKLGQSHDASAAQLSKARKTAKRLVNNLLPRFFLRRMKSLIADQLPKKTDRVVFCPLTDEQADAYANFVDSDMVTYIRTSTEMCECGSGNKRGWCCYVNLPEKEERWQNFVFPCMNILRNLSSHIGLLIPSSNDPDKHERELEYLKVALPGSWRKLYEERDSIVTLANREFCGKWKVLSKLLKFWHDNGDKVLVFSHSVRLLKLLQHLFQKTSYNVCYLDGSMSYDDRTRVIDDFNADPQQFVFLISTRAGGVGLNITSANKVVVVDPNWNPSYDLQAQDRAYRIGQTRDVEVFRLVSLGTIEEIVYARQIYKQQQANIGYTASTERRYFKGVQENKDKKGEIFGLQNLFSYQGDNLVLRDIVNKTNVAESRAGVMAVGLNMSQLEDDPSDDFLRTRTEESEDEAMSQLAALIAAGDTDPNSSDLLEAEERKKKRHKSNAIQGILAGAGVEYTHENSEVIGSSKVEARLSRRAEEQGTSTAGDRAVFAGSSQMIPEEDDDVGIDPDGLGALGHLNPTGRSDHDLDGGEDDLDLELGPFRPRYELTAVRKDIAYRHHPPQDVQQRTLCTMAKTFGYDDPIEFSLVVEEWTSSQRRTALEVFYGKLRRGEVQVGGQGSTP